MGHGHATMGAVGWVALTAPATGALGVLPMEPAHVAAGAVVTAGAALLPDADHHSGTIAHSLPPVSNVVTRAVGQVSGGHRHGTHSIVGVLAAFALAWLLAPVRIDLPWGWHDDFQIGAWLLIVFMVSFALKSLRIIRGWKTGWLASLAVGTAAVWFAPEQLWWLPLSVGMGCAIHILGDVLTIQGCPLLWPLRPKPMVETPFWAKNGHFAVPVLGTAGSGREWILVMALNLYLVAILAESLVPGSVVWVGRAIAAGVTG
ncbi:metal-dependent hydrolase [Pseudactinotalea sp. Z1748]|uniref:metal-dependent hydrolase n=1 Tax=Pseudactinotalea sp. Z1748 TaxID=3413027 RepID=UPI003C7998C8